MLKQYLLLSLVNPHNPLIMVLNKIIYFVFNYKKTQIWFSESLVYKTKLQNPLTYLISYWSLTIGNPVFKRDIGIPMGIHPAPFLANLIP